ncbi:hypothetical protein IFM89_031744, partial [Coptis chinensis]
MRLEQGVSDLISFVHSFNQSLFLHYPTTKRHLYGIGFFRVAAGLMLDGDDLHHYGWSRIERSDFLSIPGGMANSASRQIYLTFPADNTFREDVSNYFSIHEPVQDVRIPYQQKRTFGFVTFIYFETVKLILTKGNPHFVCDARVFVKHYKEKGKVPDRYMHSTFQFHSFDLCFMRQIHLLPYLFPINRKQQQPMMELGDYSSSGITDHDHRDPYDLQLSMQMESTSRMLYNTNELLMRRKLEQAKLQQAMELHSRKLMGLHLFDDNCAISCATSLSLSTITDNVSKPQANQLDRGDNDTEENSKHGDNNTHV